MVLQCSIAGRTHVFYENWMVITCEFIDHINIKYDNWVKSELFNMNIYLYS